MSKTNMELGFTATSDYPDINVEEGQKLTRAPIIVAYFTLAFKEWAEQDLALSSDEIVDTINGLEFNGADDEDKEQMVLDALQARKQGEAGEDVEPIMDAVSAQRVRADASNYGAKLPKAFTEHCQVYLDVLDYARIACLFCLDDVAGKVWSNLDPSRNWKGGAWSKEDISKLPVPGTKAPKGTIITDSNRHQWDYYRFKSAAKETINSSFYLDAAIATEPGSTLWNEIQELEDQAAKGATKEDAHKKRREMLKKKLNACAKFLRDGVTVAKALIEMERLNGKLVYEVQREEDGTPDKQAPYPLRVWPAGASSKMESFTLSNMRTMLKANAKGENVVDTAITKGGTFNAFKAAMPEKVRGKDKTVTVNNARQFFIGLDVFARYINAGGDIHINKALSDKETGSGFLDDFGSFMTLAAPIWENYKADFMEMKAKEKVATAKRTKAA